MKWILAILLLISITSFGQIGRGDDSTKYIRYQNQYGTRMPRSWWDSVSHQPYGDTAVFPKPSRPGAIMMHTDKVFYKWNGGGWEGMGGSTIVSALSNAGSGYRLVKTASGAIKTTFAGYGILKDSTSNTDGITDKVDTSSTNHIVTQSDLNDVAVAKLNTSDTTNKWINDISRSNDSVYVFKNGGWVFKYKDSVGSGGGGSKTWQQALDDGATFNKPNNVIQVRYPFTMDGQVINKDTNRAGETGSITFMGVSTDLGLAGATVFKINWPRLIAGNLGYLCWNRAHDGSTFIQYSVGDSSFQSKLPFLPNWDASQRYIVIGNYTINEAIHGTDSTTLSTAVKAGIDTLHLGRGWPLDRIIVLNGHKSPAVLAAHSQLPLLAAAVKNAAINKGVKYFDSYNYTLPFAAWNFSDSIHLNEKGQINLALGLINDPTLFDSLNYTQVNNAHVLKTLTVQGYTYLRGFNNIGNDSTTGKLAVVGDFSLYGNFARNATFLKGVSIAGDNTLNREWNLFYDPAFGEKWGIMQGGSSGNYHTDVYVSYGSTADSVRLGWRASNGVFHSNLASSTDMTKVYSTAFNVQGISSFNDNVTMSKGLSITGESTFNREWNLFNNTYNEKWGMRQGGSNPWGVEIYGAYSNAADYVALGWMGSDGTTYHPVITAYQSGIANIASLTNQNDTTTYKPLIVNSSGNIYKMNGWPAAGSGGITSINSQTGSAITIQSGIATNVVTTTNTVTVNLDPTSSSITRTIDALYSDVSNTGTSVTDIFSKSIAGLTLGSNGSSLQFEATGEYNDATATNDLQVLFAGNGIAGTGAVTVSGLGAWVIKGTITRVSSTVVRTSVTITDNSSTKNYLSYSNMTGIDLTSANILKITAQAGGGSGGTGDITGHMWLVKYNPAP